MRPLAFSLAVLLLGGPGAALADDDGPRFRAAWWCLGPNAQTIWGALFRFAPSVPVTRERWETPDGDFLDVDRLEGKPGAPTLIVLHGLEGSSRSKPVRELLGEARRRGWRGLAMNFRSCSGEPNRLRRSYHGGETGDLAFVVDRIAGEDPSAPIVCAGFSLGGNVLLKYLGERGDQAPAQLKAAVAISAPVDLAASARGLEKGFGKTYRKRLVAGLKRKTLQKMERFPDLADREAVVKAETLEQFDDAVTGPVHGFRDADEYWAASSSKRFLAGIRRPTLLINAKDDPFLAAELLPVREVERNRFLAAYFPERGGHMGFVSGWVPGWARPWAERQAARFLARQLSE